MLLPFENVNESDFIITLLILICSIVATILFKNDHKRLYNKTIENTANKILSNAHNDAVNAAKNADITTYTLTPSDIAAAARDSAKYTDTLVPCIKHFAIKGFDNTYKIGDILFGKTTRQHIAAIKKLNNYDAVAKDATVKKMVNEYKNAIKTLELGRMTKQL